MNFLPDDIINLVDTFNDTQDKRNYVLICKFFHSVCNDIYKQKTYHLIEINKRCGVDCSFSKIKTIEQAKIYFHLVQPHIWIDWAYNTTVHTQSNELNLFISENIMNYVRQVINKTYVKRQRVEYDKSLIKFR